MAKTTRKPARWDRPQQAAPQQQQPQQGKGEMPVTCPLCDAPATLAGLAHSWPSETDEPEPEERHVALRFECAASHAWQTVVLQRRGRPAVTLLTGTEPDEEGAYPVIDPVQLARARHQRQRRDAAMARLALPRGARPS